MELTRQTLHFLMAHKLGLSSRNMNSPSQKIKKILIYTGQPLENDILYLSTVPVASGDNVLLISPEESAGWQIHVAAEDVHSTIGCVLSLWQDYLYWLHRCTVLALVEHDLQDFLEAAARFLGLKWTMIDPAYRRIASWPEDSFLGKEEFGSHDFMPLEAMDNLYSSDPDYDSTYHTRGLCAYPYLALGTDDLYYYNVFQEKLYLGRFLIAVPKASVDKGILPICRTLCALAEKCHQYQFRHRSEKQGSENVLILLRRLLMGEHIPDGEIQSIFRQIGWEREHRYEALRLMSNGYYHSDETLKYYAIQFESLFPGCIACTWNGGIYCLHNMSLGDNRDFRQNCSEFLREYLFKAGVSNDFEDICKCSLYFDQAREAMELGQRHAPSLWRYDFCSFVTDYALEQCLKKYSPLDLCPEGLRALLRYDRKHPGSTLTETLYQYYASNFSIHEASQKLHIHRTTFFYRMNKIKNMVSLHPEDPKEVAVILLLLSSMKENGKAF